MKNIYSRRQASQGDPIVAHTTRRRSSKTSITKDSMAFYLHYKICSKIFSSLNQLFWLNDYLEILISGYVITIISEGLTILLRPAKKKPFTFWMRPKLTSMKNVNFMTQGAKLSYIEPPLLLECSSLLTESVNHEFAQYHHVRWSRIQRYRACTPMSLPKKSRSRVEGWRKWGRIEGKILYSFWWVQLEAKYAAGLVAQGLSRRVCDPSHAPLQSHEDIQSFGF